MARFVKTARKSPSNGSKGKVAIVKEEAGEDPSKPLAAKAARKTIPRKRFIFPRRPRRYRPRSVTLREIKKFKKQTNQLIRKTPFTGLYESIASEIDCGQLHFARGATNALNEVCEALLVQYFTALNIPALHAQRVMVMLKNAAVLKQLMKLLD